MSDDGFASPVLVALLALAGLLCLATADAANVLVTRARVQAAADAASLAAAAAQWTGDEPDEAARDVSERNAARLEDCECEPHGRHAIVTVSAPTRIRMLGVAPSRVSARAEARIDAARLFEPPS